jgi:hypothetical protein
MIMMFTPVSGHGASADSKSTAIAWPGRAVACTSAI